MAGMKGLFKDTAIYGLSSMLGRFINWFLTPFYTFYLAKAELGALSNYYAGTALILILLIMGLETGFFRFAGNPDEDKNRVYSTCITMVTVMSLLFVGAVAIWMNPIANFIGAAAHPDYVMYLAVIIACDAISSIPFVYLRLNNHPWKFAAIKLFSIGLNIVLNLFFIVLCPILVQKGYGNSIAWFYREDYNLGYVLLSNLISSAVTLLLLGRFIFAVKYVFDHPLMKRIMRYSAPLIVLGLAGVMNQHLDKLIYPYILTDDPTAWEQLGVYAANAKIAVILVMFTQAFRYAFEPFIFSKHAGQDKRSAYADATKYFVISGLFIFLAVIFYIDIVKQLIHSSYHEGLKVVPIIMLADLFNGVFFNLSLWYKLTDRTKWGAWFSLMGLVIIAIGNVVFVPIYGYMACAWSAFVCYLLLMLVSYFMGQHYYPVPYNLKRIALYSVLAMVLWGVSELVVPDALWIRLLFNTLLLGIYVVVVAKFENILKSRRFSLR